MLMFLFVISTAAKAGTALIQRLDTGAPFTEAHPLLGVSLRRQGGAQAAQTEETSGSYNERFKSLSARGTACECSG